MIFEESLIRSADGKSKLMLGRMESFYRDSITHNQSFWAEANLDAQFLSGSQEFYNSMYGPLFPGKRKNFFFNHIRPIVNMQTGFQRQNRKTTVVMPQHKADEITADQLTKVMMWVHEKDMMYETISEAYMRGPCATGLSLLQIWIDYRTDPISGDIRMDCCPYNTFLIDPFFTKKDFSDCSACWKRSYLTRREVISLLPAHAEEIMSLPTSGKDGKFFFDSTTRSFANPNKLTYDEFWYRDYRMQDLLVDIQTGETYEWRGNSENLDDYLRLYPTIQLQKNEIPTVKCAIVVEGRCIVDDNITGIDDFPFVPCIGYYFPELGNLSERIQGTVRGLRDAQYIYNRKMILEADTLESVKSSGYIYKEDALVDPTCIFQTGNGQGIAIKKGYDIQSAVQQIMPQVIPPTTQELRRDIKLEMNYISGMSEESTGMAVKDVAGVLAALRSKAANVGQQVLLDNLDQAQRIAGKIILKLIQTNFMPGKVQAILGPDEELSPSFHNHVWAEYNCVVEEGIYTATQRQMQLAQLIELKQLGIAIPDDVILDAATVQNKKELTDSIKRSQEQAMQMQQKQEQAAIQELQSRADLSDARASADRGLAIERASRVQENEALAIERKAAAKKDEEQAVLNMVRALKEIEQIDINQLEKLVALSRLLSEPTIAGQGNIAGSMDQGETNAYEKAEESNYNSGQETT